jgi:hypothetical protein
MQIFSMEHGIKRNFDSGNYKDIVNELKRVENSESVLYDASNYDTIDFIDLILCSQDWIDKKFIFNLIDDLKYIVMENKRLKKENDAYYIEYGELEND